MTGLELSANAAATVSIVLAGRNSIHTWWTGIVGCLLFAVVFCRSQLYADVALQGFFVVTSVMGWHRWLRSDHAGLAPVTRTDRKTWWWVIPSGVLATLGYGTLLHTYTDAYAPFLDSAVLVFSVIAQLLLMQRRLETWGFWLLVNTIAVPLYASRELWLTSALYACYWVNALVAFHHWRGAFTTDAVGTAPVRS